MTLRFRITFTKKLQEVNIPEGLQYQALDWITSWISENGFNCVRLTYSIDMALNPSQAVFESFTEAADSTGAPLAAMQANYNQAVSKNPWLFNSSTLSTYDTVINSLATKNIAVVLDNHVSKASWCCNYTDGNGWWDTASGYIDANSRYFNTTNWLSGLEAMASFASSHPNVVAMSLRNELRPFLGQDLNNHADWYNYVGQGATKIHTANSNLLIVIGGVMSATDASFLRNSPLDTSGWPNRTVWEFHSYSWDFPIGSPLCTVYDSVWGLAAGYLLEDGEAFTGPLWLSEFGVAQAELASDPLGTIYEGNEQQYLKCVHDYMTSNDADWAVWAMQGSYYVRNGQVNLDEGYGLLNTNWTDWRNPLFKTVLAGMLEVTQGPGV